MLFMMMSVMPTALVASFVVTGLAAMIGNTGMRLLTRLQSFSPAR